MRIHRIVNRIPRISSAVVAVALIVGAVSPVQAYLKKVAPRQDETSAELRALGVCYDYRTACKESNAFADKVRVFLFVRDQRILDSGEKLVAEVRIVDLSDYTRSQVRYFPVTIDRDVEGEYKPAHFDVVNQGEDDPVIDPAKVYRFFVNLHRESDNYDEQSAWGRVPNPFYVATLGDDEMDLARRQIVMRTFKEFYYRKQGWRSDARYPMDCYAYYMWATGFCTVGAENGRTVLGRLFGKRVPYHRGSQISSLMENGPIHADYVRKSGHSFMLLAYDAERGHVWTMEGNFNSTIEVVIRSVNSGWKVGHLVEAHIRDDVFRQASFGERVEKR